jgi:phosphoribosylformylglycinamidine synthase
MIHRIDIQSADLARTAAAGIDPEGEAIRRQIIEFGLPAGPITTRRIFLIDAEATPEQMRGVAQELLSDPIVEIAELLEQPPIDKGCSRIEIHLKAGVMDPVAASTESVMRQMGLKVRQVRTGRAYLIQGSISREQLATIASRVLANGVIESVHFNAHLPKKFEAGRPYQFKLTHVPIRQLDDDQLKEMSRKGHLFLSLPEMKAVQSYFRDQSREPTDIELETLAQTWSEHCVHKTLKSAVELEVKDASGKTVQTRKYGNLIRDTIFASTQQLMKQYPGFCLSVFKDNAGVIVFDETDAVCFKVETHNHPSALEPYGGAATGAGGVIRDILGTGLAAKPVANTDVFCVAYPDPLADQSSRTAANAQRPTTLPKGIIHPKRILQQVVAGVRDYGNRMGIPTLNGAVYFDDRYLGNPLVFCGCVGLIPRDKIEKESRRGDAIVVMGGRTGRDGIHGATFSSAELTDTHADEFSHAVQIGNAITQKKMADVILAARDLNLFSAVTDCGAGGLSSAVGEMGEKIGAEVYLDRVPLKYEGLNYAEIWISEAQERMVLSVPQDKVDQLLALSRAEDVEATVIGQFGTPNRELILHYQSHEVGRLAMKFMHDGIPMPTRKAVMNHPTPNAPHAASSTQHPALSTGQRLLALLAHPNIASKHWIIRQYDHEVQGGSVIKPLTGPLQVGPSDASVIRPKLNSMRGIAIGCGMAPYVKDPYWMAIYSIDEAIRNVIAVGGNPAKTAILDNFCWPSVDDEQTMGTLAVACEACRDAALAYGIPFISGKDSLHNHFTNQETGEVLRIPNTLLISALSVLADVRKCVTMDLKRTDTQLLLVKAKDPVDLKNLANLHPQMAAALASGNILSCHDVSDGGAVVAAAEMAIASNIGLKFDAAWIESKAAWIEVPGQYLVEIDAKNEASLRAHLPDADVAHIGQTQTSTLLAGFADASGSVEIPLTQATAAWRGTLDW